MTDIQRYEPWPQEWPQEDANGDLVLYEDHIKVVESIKADITELLELLQRAVDGYGQKMRTATDKKEKRDWQSMLIAAVDIQQAVLATVSKTHQIKDATK